MGAFTPQGLVAAVTQLFEMNNYRVDGPVQLHGAEIDLVATPLGDPFGRKVYIEATVEHVDNEKYGKDVGKLAMIANIEPGSQKVIVSSAGFSLPVKERASRSDIWTLTYDELFQRFEKFEPYIARFTSTGAAAKALKELDAVYEEPHFEDKNGNESAPGYLSIWKNSESTDRKWIVVTGEYGTGKTALTQVLLYRWLLDYKSNASLPIPFRIELRNFARQFDARGLLHHFLDTNGLSHVPIEFAERLVRSGRAVLLLDGYDEMAQYFNARERRQCLEALATLSAEGAKGVLTSRPNYFTQSEELQVFEVLYASLRSTTYFSNTSQLLDKEAEIDRLLAHFLDQFERSLRDLTQEQTASLVSRRLKDDREGLQVVLGLLNRVFRQAADGNKSLSGKPVIVSYLLEVVDQLKTTGNEAQPSSLTEWQIYKVIVDQLMIRDLARSAEILPDQRRRFLQKLAAYLSRRGHDTISEDEFRDLVLSSFKREINRHTGEARNDAASRYFSDLRSSATLTRALSTQGEGWRFSHNSLREYLVAEELVQSLLSGNGAATERVGVSDAMRAFSASVEKSTQEQLMSSLQSLWQSSTVDGAVKGQFMELLWDGFMTKLSSEGGSTRLVLEKIAGDLRRLSGVELRRLDLSTVLRPAELSGISFRAGSLSDIRLVGADLRGADFASTTLDNVDLTDCNLTDANFNSSTIFDVNVSGAILKNADFRGIDAGALCMIVPGVASATMRLEGNYAVGYLKAEGAVTDPVPDFFVLFHHPRFEIVLKIVENLTKQTLHQRRGLEQRGAAHVDVPFARSFVDFLLNKGFVDVPKARKDMLETTEAGRDVFQKFLVGNVVDDRLKTFFE